MKSFSPPSGLDFVLSDNRAGRRANATIRRQSVWYVARRHVDSKR